MPILKLQRELFSLTLSLSLFGFAQAMVGIFVPLLLITSGAEVWQVGAFYAVAALVKLVINYPVARFIIQKHGVHIALGIGYLAAIVQLASLQAFVVTGETWWLVGAAVGMAFTNSCIWISQHLHISAVMETQTKSSSVATMESINQVSGVFAPLLGGLIGGLFGPGWLISMAIAVLLASLVPLRAVGQLHRNQANDDQTPVRYSLNGAPKRDLAANFSYNIETVVGTLVWPIFLAVQIGTYREIGYISALAALAAVVALYIAGRRGDSGKGRKVLTEGVALSSLINIGRLFVTSATAVTAITAAYRATLAYGQNAWTSTYYAHAKRGRGAYIMSMEIMCDVAHALIWGTLAVVAYYFSSETLFMVAFTIAAVFAWGCLLITKERRS